MRGTGEDEQNGRRSFTLSELRLQFPVVTVVDGNPKSIFLHWIRTSLPAVTWILLMPDNLPSEWREWSVQVIGTDSRIRHVDAILGIMESFNATLFTLKYVTTVTWGHLNTLVLVFTWSGSLASCSAGSEKDPPPWADSLNSRCPIRLHLSHLQVKQTFVHVHVYHWSHQKHHRLTFRVFTL